MPSGYMQSAARDPMNFTMAQWQQAKRRGKDPREIKTALQDCWAVSDTQGSFAKALKERGYTLAKGDRRGFVAIDYKCNVFSLSKKWIGVSAKDVRAKLTDQKTLPSVEAAKAQIAKDMSKHLAKISVHTDQTIQTRLSEIERKRKLLVQQQTQTREALKEQQGKCFHAENLKRQERYSNGWCGLFDRITGKSRRIKQGNEEEAYKSIQRNQKERDALIFEHLHQRQIMQTRIERLKNLNQKRQQALNHDIQQYREIREQQRKIFERQHQHPSPKSHGYER